MLQRKRKYKTNINVNHLRRRLQEISAVLMEAQLMF